MTAHEPGGDALGRFTRGAHALLRARLAALRAFPGQLADESRLFLRDVAAKRQRRAALAAAPPASEGFAPRAAHARERDADDGLDELPEDTDETLDSTADDALEATTDATTDGTARGVPRMRGATTIVAGPGDDASSIIGRLDAAQEVEVLLLVPRRARGLRDAMAWPRIAAHVRQRGLALRVLASRREVRLHAESAGLPAARTVRGLRPRAALRVPLGVGEAVLRAPPLGPLLRLGGLAVVLLAVIGALVFYVPSAEIVIAPPAETLSGSMRVRLNPVAETELSLGVVAAGSVQRTVVSVVSTSTTGTATIGDIAARVQLQFSNAAEADITLPVGTPVDDEGGFTFTTSEAVTVPAGGEAEVGAQAIRPGTAGNLAEDSLRLLIGFPPTLSVSNLEAAAGGTDTEVPAVAPEDVVSVGAIAEQVLRRAGARELLSTSEDATVFPETISVVILSQDPLVQVGEPADAFLMEYVALVSALVLTGDEARRAGEQLLVGALPEGLALLPGTTEVVADGASFEGGRLVVDLTATGLATPLIDAASLRGELTGVSPATAATRLREQLALDAEPLIRVHPGWLPDWRMPQRAARISITLVSAEVLAAEIAGEPDEGEEPDAAIEGATADGGDE